MLKINQKLQNFLSGKDKTGKITVGFSLSWVVLPALKLLCESDMPLCITLPDARAADLFLEDFNAFSALLKIEKEVLLLPECGRGKLLFPGGEARRARALNRILNDPPPVIIGSSIISTCRFSN